jgi:hypothetical protein
MSGVLLAHMARRSYSYLAWQISLQIASFFLCTLLSQKYRRLVARDTDGFWVAIPTDFGHKYRLFMVSFTDALWVEIPTGSGQFYRWVMVSCTCKIPAKRGKTVMRVRVALYVCLFV